MIRIRLERPEVCNELWEGIGWFKDGVLMARVVIEQYIPDPDKWPADCVDGWVPVEVVDG